MILIDNADDHHDDGVMSMIMIQRTRYDINCYFNKCCIDDNNIEIKT